MATVGSKSRAERGRVSDAVGALDPTVAIRMMRGREWVRLELRVEGGGWGLLGGVAVIIRELPLAAVVQLVNGWAAAPRRTGARDALPYPGTATLDHDGALPDGLTDRALAAAADRLHPVFAATEPAERARLVDGLLTATAIRPALVADGDAISPDRRYCSITCQNRSRVAAYRRKRRTSS
jgi:hypothetical protein